MQITQITSREFNHDVGKAKRASKKGPVIITNQGNPSQVLLDFEEYKRLIDLQQSVAETFFMPGAEDIETEPQNIDFKCKEVERD